MSTRHTDMHTRFDIVPVKTDQQREEAEAWASLTEGHEVHIPRDVACFTVRRGATIVSVFTFSQMPVVSMFFDRDGEAVQTVRVFDLIRAAMQVSGNRPVVVVEDGSPLAPLAPRAMEPIWSDCKAYRLG